MLLVKTQSQNAPILKRLNKDNSFLIAIQTFLDVSQFWSIITSLSTPL